MTLKMSCCNTSILRRTFFRGLPLWGAYLLCWIIAMPVAILSNGTTQDLVYIQDYILEAAAGSSVVVNFLYGLGAACFACAFLYKPRSANFFAALPIRREKLFFTKFLAGALYSFLPNLLICLLTVLSGACIGCNLFEQSLVWLGSQTLSFLFYYSFAMVVAMIVGNLVALPLIYLMLNFAAVLVEELVRELLRLFVRGAWFADEPMFWWASPVPYTIASDYRVGVDYIWGERQLEAVSFRGWPLLLQYAAVGVIFSMIALWLFKRRRMESAGDFIAVKALKPLFLHCFTVGCAIVLGLMLSSIVTGGSLTGSFMTVLICMLTGAFIGYFVGQMLLHRSVRVFRSRYFANYGVTALIILSVMLCVRFDIFGYSSFVPQLEDVEGVCLSYDEVFCTDRDFIQQTIQCHNAILKQEQTEGDWGYRTAQLTYRMKDGDLVRRQFPVAVSEKDSKDPNSAIRMYEDLINDPDYIVLCELGGTYTQDTFESCFIYNERGAKIYLNAEETYDFLVTCVEPDLRETTIGWRSYSGYDGRGDYAGVHVQFFIRPEDANDRSQEVTGISVTTDASRILAYAQAKGLTPESTEAVAIIGGADGPTSVYVTGK